WRMFFLAGNQLKGSRDDRMKKKTSAHGKPAQRRAASQDGPSGRRPRPGAGALRQGVSGAAKPGREANTISGGGQKPFTGAGKLRRRAIQLDHSLEPARHRAQALAGRSRGPGPGQAEERFRPNPVRAGAIVTEEN